MPGSWAPRVGLLSEADLREFAGQALFNRGGASVSAPAGWSTRFQDLVEALNGRGSQDGRDMTEDAQASLTAAGAAGTIIIGIDANDRVYVESSVVDFTIGADARNAAFGFAVAGYGLVGGAAPFRRTADTDWTRGNVTALFSVDPAGAPGLFVVPSVSYQAQSVVTLIRKVDQGDADAVAATTCLETLDNAVYDAAAGNRRIRWGINAEGKVWTSWPVGVTPGVVWAQASFRDRLGFSGAEAVVASGGLRTMTADNWPLGVLVPRRQPRRVKMTSGGVRNVVRQTNGNTVSNTVARWYGWQIEVWLGSTTDTPDEVPHFLRRWLPYAESGGVVLYPEWGDERRAVEALAQNTYSILQTPESGGRRGRRMCSLAASSLGEVVIEHEGEDQEYRTAPLTIVLDERVEE